VKQGDWSVRNLARPATHPGLTQEGYPLPVGVRRVSAKHSNTNCRKCDRRRLRRSAEKKSETVGSTRPDS
jgi:hypothetical protein